MIKNGCNLHNIRCGIQRGLALISLRNFEAPELKLSPCTKGLESPKVLMTKLFLLSNNNSPVEL